MEERTCRQRVCLVFACSGSIISGESKNAILEDIRTNYDAARQDEYDYISFCPDLKGTPVITNLLTQSPMWNVLNEALGINNFGHDGGQIAIRKAHNHADERIWGYHIDGVPNAQNGLKGQQISNFTALVGIYLSDSPRNFSGNFAVWPGSHKVLEQYFRYHGPDAMDMGMPKVDIGEPVQLDTKAGDAVLCHYQLGHSVATNTSDVDRIAIYFRIWLNDINERRWELLTNIWNGWKII